MKFEWRRDAYGKDRRSLFLCGLYVGSVIPVKFDAGPFRAWIMTDDEGESMGDDFPTENTAREAVYTEALRIIAENKD